MSILVNAIDALTADEQAQPSAPRCISIRTDVILPTRIGITIADNGPGIPAAIVDRVFDPFFTTKPIGEGTGLGLAIARQIIVEKHNGQLRCTSEVGRGTEFIIELPVRQ